MKKVLGNKKAIALFVLPPLILYSIIVVLPVLWSFYYSLYSGTPGLKWKFSGLGNYLKLFRDRNFLEALAVNLKYIGFTMLGQVGGGLLMALLFRFWLKKYKNIIRTIIFFPTVLPTVAVGQLFAKIYEIQPNYGLLNSLLSRIGLQQLVQPWIGQASTALPALIIMDIWTGIGFHSIILYGALLDIPGDIIEAGRIDGCSSWQLFRSILAPLLRPMLISSAVFSFSGTVKMFESALALTNGGPGTATRSLSMYMYSVSFTYNKAGYGSVIAIFIFLLCIFGSGLINLFDRKEE
ncbi:carbohydrate ABC transporter permease [Lachnoclostridium sp. Marseille-P6806]|uniref:carbohydrate ABC transporter permease n=1 Tax=Lachnoclostridium sp. Marseille-P6806 TaxID=2364793 RepID=UPI0010309507|nr:sugar ABC transporter permease [Lachnoclostridium sp. Marseille-P6806]